jgi:hypothetical protein
MAASFAEMDDRVTFLEQLQQATGPVMLMNKFNVAPEDVDRLLEAWADDAAFMKQQPGFISTQLHRGIGKSTRLSTSQSGSRPLRLAAHSARPSSRRASATIQTAPSRRRTCSRRSRCLGFALSKTRALVHRSRPRTTVGFGAALRRAQSDPEWAQGLADGAVGQGELPGMSLSDPISGCRRRRRALPSPTTATARGCPVRSRPTPALVCPCQRRTALRHRWPAGRPRVWRGSLSTRRPPRSMAKLRPSTWEASEPKPRLPEPTVTPALPSSAATTAANRGSTTSAFTHDSSRHVCAESSSEWCSSCVLSALCRPQV